MQEHPPSLTIPGWIIGLTACVPGGISLYLLIQAHMLRLEPIGCGGESGCQAVLQSSWSKVLGVLRHRGGNNYVRCNSVLCADSYPEQISRKVTIDLEQALFAEWTHHCGGRLVHRPAMACRWGVLCLVPCGSCDRGRRCSVHLVVRDSRQTWTMGSSDHWGCDDWNDGDGAGGVAVFRSSAGAVD